MSETDYLFQPIKIGNNISENRIAINAMEYCDADEEGNPGEKTFRKK